MRQKQILNKKVKPEPAYTGYSTADKWKVRADVAGLTLMHKGSDLNILGLTYDCSDIDLFNKTFGVKKAIVVERDYNTRQSIKQKGAEFNLEVRSSDIDNYILNRQGHRLDMVFLDYCGTMTEKHERAASHLLQGDNPPLVFITVSEKEIRTSKAVNGFDPQNYTLPGCIKIYHRRYEGKKRPNGTAPTMHVYGFQSAKACL
jgi:hypothetical protein